MLSVENHLQLAAIETCHWPRISSPFVAYRSTNLVELLGSTTVRGLWEVCALSSSMQKDHSAAFSLKTCFLAGLPPRSGC